MAIGGLICTVGNLWCAFAGSFPEFVAARFVAGLGAGWVQSAGMIVLADISTPAQRGRMMSIYQGTFLFSVGIGPFPGGLLAQHFGLAAPFAARSPSPPAQPACSPGSSSPRREPSRRGRPGRRAEHRALPAADAHAGLAAPAT